MRIFILIRAYLAHVQKINNFFALGQKLERDRGDDKQVINLIRIIIIQIPKRMRAFHEVQYIIIPHQP